MKIKALLSITIFAFLLGGCAKLQGLMILKSYGDSQEQIKRYVEKQEKLFFKLIEDIKADNLQAGISKDRFIRIYGEPILSERDESSSGQQVLLFRHPTNFFKSDRVYAYFDQSQKLISWDYKPYQSPE